MSRVSDSTSWRRHFFYRTESFKTTWRFRFGVLLVLVVTIWATRGWWSVAIANSLVCQGTGASSDAIFLENFNYDYFVFEHAAELRRRGLAPRVLVPVPADATTSWPNDVAVGVSEVMARISRLGPVEFIPIREMEPITLNAARDVRRFLEANRIRSVVVVSPLFRSRRSSLIYARTFEGAGVTVTCDPARSLYQTGTWMESWHGIQEVAEQWIKLQYYRLYVLPFRATR